MLILDDLFGGIFPGFFLPLHQTLTSVETLQFQSKYLIDCEALDKIAEFQVKYMLWLMLRQLEAALYLRFLIIDLRYSLKKIIFQVQCTINVSNS